MRLAYYALGFIIFGSIAIVLSLPLVSSRGELEKPKIASDKMIVYVDMDRLMRLHPSSGALALMKRIAADLRADKRTMPFAIERDAYLVNASVVSDRIKCSISREGLEADAAQAAIGALRELESAQREALQARIRATRRTMEESASADIKAQVRDIEQETSRKLRDVAERYAADRINACLKIGALKVADKSFKLLIERSGANIAKNRSAVDSPAESELVAGESAAIDAKLSVLQSDFSRTIDIGDGEDARIKEEARAKIKALWSDSTANIEKRLSDIEKDANAKIERDIISAQNEIIQEISSFGKLFGAEENSTRKTVGYARATANLAKGASIVMQRRGPAFDSVDKIVEVLEQRIRLDLSRAVQMLANKQGINVTFVRHRGGLPDRTKEFERKLRCLSWNECGPVLCDTRG